MLYTGMLGDGKSLISLHPAHLLLGVSKLVQIVNAVQDSALEGHCGIQVVLPAALIDGQPLEHQPL